MIIDGRKLAEGLFVTLAQERRSLTKPIHLEAVLVGEDPGSVHYLKQKEKAAERIGVAFGVTKVPVAIDTAALKERIEALNKDPKNTGLIVQLPLPPHIDAATILDGVPKGKDVDALSGAVLGAFIDGTSEILPPVVGAIAAILKDYKLDPQGKRVAIVGTGRLVGIPVAIWFSHQGAVTCLLGRNGAENSKAMGEADILVAGSGTPRAITGDMVKQGAVVLDVGYEIVNGKPVGDVDFESVAPKASLITPVPGGIGPLTVVALFRNLLTLAKVQN